MKRFPPVQTERRAGQKVWLGKVSYQEAWQNLISFKSFRNERPVGYCTLPLEESTDAACLFVSFSLFLVPLCFDLYSLRLVTSGEVQDVSS